MNRPSSPRLILHNCRIFDPTIAGPSKATALAVEGNRISAMGSDDDILHLAGSATGIINGNNHWLLPALTDAHTHLSAYAARKLQIDFNDCDSLAEGLQKIRRTVEKSPEGSWVIGGGWDKNAWGMDGFPTKTMLDEISTQHFMAFQSKDWHSLWVNSPTLTICEINDTTADPAGGWILRMPGSQAPSGVLQETACEIVQRSIAPPPLEKLYPALQETFAEFHRFGITAVHSVETPYDFANYQSLYERGDLGLRIFWYFPVKYLQDSKEKGYIARSGNSFLKICGVKMFMDGALGSQTADMLSPYDGLEHTGVEVLTMDDLSDKVERCVELGLSCAIHAIGDRANRKVLQAFAAVRDASIAADLRHRVEHAQLLHPDDIDKFAANGVIASAQPIHLAADIPMIDRYWGKRGRYAYAFGSLHKGGTRLIFGSDTPIESFDPWRGMYSAIARKQHCDPALDSFYPEEKISLLEAIRAYTSECAWTVWEEEEQGSVTTGKVADFILIDQDIFHSPDSALLENKVLLTVQSGNILYRDF